MLGGGGVGGQTHRALRGQPCDGPEEGVGEDAQGARGPWWGEGLSKDGSEEGRAAAGGGFPLLPPLLPHLSGLTLGCQEVSVRTGGEGSLPALELGRGWRRKTPFLNSCYKLRHCARCVSCFISGNYHNNNGLVFPF